MRLWFARDIWRYRNVFWLIDWLIDLTVEWVKYEHVTYRWHSIHCTIGVGSGASENFCWRVYWLTYSLTFRRGTRGNAVLIVKVFKKCLRTHYGQRCEPFSAAKALLNSLKNFLVVIPTPGILQKRPRLLDPDTKFLLSRQRSHDSFFTNRPLVDGL